MLAGGQFGQPPGDLGQLQPIDPAPLVVIQGRADAAIRASSLKGFSMKSRAPAFIALTAMATSPWPVMMITGMRSLPRQIGLQFQTAHAGHPHVQQQAPGPARIIAGAGRHRRNSKDWARRPVESISHSREWRMAWSSSTTKTVGSLFIDSLPTGE